jgi:hypothetical protein
VKRSHALNKLASVNDTAAYYAVEQVEVLERLEQASYAHMKFQDDQAVAQTRLLDAILTELKGIREEQR